MPKSSPPLAFVWNTPSVRAHDLPPALRERIAGLARRLREAHDEYEQAAQSWTQEAAERKRGARKVREDTLREIENLLAREGETERLAELKRLPFAQKFGELDAWIRVAPAAGESPTAPEGPRVATAGMRIEAEETTGVYEPVDEKTHVYGPVNQTARAQEPVNETTGIYEPPETTRVYEPVNLTAAAAAAAEPELATEPELHTALRTKPDATLPTPVPASMETESGDSTFSAPAGATSETSVTTVVASGVVPVSVPPPELSAHPTSLEPDPAPAPAPAAAIVRPSLPILPMVAYGTRRSLFWSMVGGVALIVIALAVVVGWKAIQ